MTESASSSASMPSATQISRMRSIRSLKSTERKLKCWQRDAIVAGILCDSVVQRMKTAHWRRLFDGLQQRVESLARDLVRFVDDEDLVAVARGLIADVLAQFAHLIDAAIRCRVDFDHVDRSAGRDFEAARADAAGLIGRAFFAVEAAGDDARGGGLAGAALAGKDVAVRDAVLRDRVAQSGVDVLLVQHIVERLGTIFARDDLVHGEGRFEA